MPAPSKIDQLPEAIRDELGQRLVLQSFAGYQALSEWLAEQGFEITKSSVHRWGSKLEERVAAMKTATDAARTIAAASPDDEGHMADALMRLTQEHVFQLLMKVQVDPEKVDFNKLIRGVADLARGTATLKRYQSEMKAKTKAAAEAVEKIVKGTGITPETIQRIRTEIYGITG